MESEYEREKAKNTYIEKKIGKGKGTSKGKEHGKEI